LERREATEIGQTEPEDYRDMAEYNAAMRTMDLINAADRVESKRGRERRDKEAERNWSRLSKLTIGHQRGYALIGVLRLGSQSRGSLARTRSHTRDSLRNPRVRYVRECV